MSNGSIIGFEWDSGNHEKSLLKHTVAWFEAEQVFFNEPKYIDPDMSHSGKEQRFSLLGRTHTGRLLFLTFTTRKNLIRIISAGPMNRKEKTIYEKRTQENS